MEDKKENYTDVFYTAVGHNGDFKIAFNPDFQNHINIDGLLTQTDKRTLKKITNKVVKRALKEHSKNL